MQLEEGDIALKVQRTCREVMPEPLVRLSSIAAIAADPKDRREASAALDSILERLLKQFVNQVLVLTRPQAYTCGDSLPAVESGHHAAGDRCFRFVSAL